MLHLPGQSLPAWAANCATGVGGRGLIYDLPEHEYHGTRALLGKSSLCIAIERSGKHFKDWLDHGERTAEDTEWKVRGRALHGILLEPDFFRDRFAVLPNFGEMTKPRNRQARDEWIRENARSKQVLTAAWAEQVEAMAASVRQHKRAAKLLQNAQTEVTALWVDPGTGLPLKSRADAISELHGVYADVKGCADASISAFARTAKRFRYYIQDPLYSRAFHENNVDVDNFVFIAVEWDPPYAVGIYQMTDKARLAGEKAYEAGLMRVSRWVEDGEFPDLNEGRLEEIDVSDHTLADAEKHYEAEAAHYED